MKFEETFKLLTGADWLQEMKVEGEPGLFDRALSQEDRDLMHFLRPLYGAYKKSPPKLYLNPGAGIGQHAVHSSEFIPCGSIVTEYLGLWNAQNRAGSSYRWGPIDGTSYRNFGPMVEDGFPNLCAFHLLDTEGLPLRIVFVALDDILPDEVLTINYGMSHSVKVHDHIEYRYPEMAAFFSENSPLSIAQKIRSMQSTPRIGLSWEQNMELESCIAKLQYLYQTPSAMEALLSNEVIDLQEAFSFYDKIDNRLCLLGYTMVPRRCQEEITQNLNKTLKSKDF